MSDVAKLTSLRYYDLRNGQIKLTSPPPKSPTVMCLGNFDGVHAAHASLLRQGLALRDQRIPHGACGVFTFLIPSSEYRKAALTSSPKSELLTTMEEKLRIMASLGMEFAYVCDFEEIRAWSPEHFLDFLAKDLGVRGAVCGFNYRFGAGGKGTAQELAAYFDRPNEGYDCHVAPPFMLDGDTVSSTRIRRLLQAGEVVTATAYLGHTYVLEAPVVKGKQLGRTWGLPTANQYFPEGSLIPAHGVYAVLCHTPSGIFPGVANVGSHPTVDHNAAVNCETHIIGFSQDLYGYEMRIEFLCFLRPETRFSTVEELKAAISGDSHRAETYVKNYLNNKK